MKGPFLYFDIRVMAAAILPPALSPATVKVPGFMAYPMDFTRSGAVHMTL